MRFRTKLCSAGATLGLLAGGSLAILPQQVGAAPVDIGTTVSLTCVGADETTNALLGNLGGSLAIDTIVTPDPENPATLAQGQSSTVYFDVNMVLPQDLVDLAIGALGVSSLDVENFNLPVVATGGGTGGPFNALPDAFTVGLVPISVPTQTASGDVTIVDDTTATEFQVDGDPSFTVIARNIDDGEGGFTDLPLYLTCTQDTTPSFGAINAGDPVDSAAISGVVTNASSNPVEGVAVDLRDATGLNRVATITHTDANGAYSFADLPFGTYTVYVRPVAGQYQGQWYGGASARSGAAPLTLTVAGINDADVVLPGVGTSISGNVSDGTSGVNGATVDLRDSSGTSRVALVQTDIDGNYSVEGLAPGTYRVYFRSASCTGQWYNNAGQRSGSTAIDTTGGSATGIDATLSCSLNG